MRFCFDVPMFSAKSKQKLLKDNKVKIYYYCFKMDALNKDLTAF